MVERPFSNARPAGPFVEQNSGGPPRPDAPAAGRREPRTEEEIVEFMDRVFYSAWGKEYAPRFADGMFPSIGGERRKQLINQAKLSAGAGIIARPRFGRSREEIIRVYLDNRDINVPEDWP